MALYSQAHRPSWLIDIVFYLGRGEDKILDKKNKKKKKKQASFSFYEQLFHQWALQLQAS